MRGKLLSGILNEKQDSKYFGPSSKDENMLANAKKYYPPESENIEVEAYDCKLMNDPCKQSEMISKESQEQNTYQISRSTHLSSDCQMQQHSRSVESTGFKGN
ncbi:hypothetical protein ACOME3_004143 [Neoechinorhynchus agilis]